MIKLPSQPIGKQASYGKMFGNKDASKKWEFPSLWRDSIVVKVSHSQKIGPKDSDVMEIPSSIQIKCFDASLFDTHVEQGMFNKQTVEILHDPR